MPITKPTRESIRYTDIDINATIHPEKKDILLTSNAESVKRSIKNLMFTDRYERPFQPALGAGLPQYLFENIEPLTAHVIRNRIIQTIEVYGGGAAGIGLAHPAQLRGMKAGPPPCKGSHNSYTKLSPSGSVAEWSKINS